MRRFVKKYFVHLFVIAIVAGGIIVMVQQSFRVAALIEKKSIELKQVKMDQVLAEEYLQNVNEFKKNAQYISENEQYLDVLLPNNDDEKVKLFSDLEQIARDTGNVNVVLAVKNAAKEATEKKEVAGKKDEKKSLIVPNAKDYLSINISITGEYNDLVAFLEKLENMQYFSDVLSVKVGKITQEQQSTQSSENIDDEEIVVVPKKNLLKSEINAAFYVNAIDK